MGNALRRCDRCRRHVRVDEVRCPFCVVESRTRGLATAMIVGATLGACSGRELGQPMQDETSTSTTTTPTPVDTGDTASSAATTLATTTSTTVMSETGPAETSSGTTDDDDGLGCAFYGGCPPDGGSPSIECDLWTQDCARGEKCMPWNNTGGGAWNATRCSPLDPDAVAVGEPCTVDGDGVSGIDNCELGAMCWNVDLKTNEGTCVDFCTGSAERPSCEDPEASCAIANDGVLILCLQSCDPLIQDCAMDEACMLVGSVFVCLAAFEDAAAHGEVCEALNACEAGLYCAVPEYVFECPGAACCTEYCDLEADEPDAACSGTANGETCIALFDDGQYPNIGICRLPD